MELTQVHRSVIIARLLKLI